MYVQVGWWSEALSYSFLVFVFLESLKIFCQVWLLALVRLDQSPSCPRCLVLRPRRGRVCEAAQKVRFLFLSLNLSKTMNLFWSGEFCFRGQKKRKSNEARCGSLSCLWTCRKLWICSGQVNFVQGAKKKENPAKPGAVPFLVFEPVETKFRRLIDELPPKRAKKWRAKTFNVDLRRDSKFNFFAMKTWPWTIDLKT